MALLSLQYLRALAALMVVVFHVLDSPGRLGGALDLPKFDLGESGVDLFFVISGFIIWLTTREGRSTPAAFFRRRVLRIVPLYWTLTLLLAAVALILPNLLGATVFDPAHLLASLLFWPYPHPTLGLPNPVLFVGWTLNYEMLFYAVFALLLPLERAVQAAAFLALCLLAALLGQAFHPAGALGFYADPIILEFALGVLVGAAYLAPYRPPPWLALLSLAGGVAGLVVLADLPVHRVVSAGLPMALVVYGAVCLERAWPRAPLSLPLLIGNASYALYLTHLFALPVGQIVWRKLFGVPEGVGAGLLYVAGVTLACVLAGILTHWFVERPLQQWVSRPVPPSRWSLPGRTVLGRFAAATGR